MSANSLTTGATLHSRSPQTVRKITHDVFCLSSENSQHVLTQLKATLRTTLSIETEIYTQNVAHFNKVP